MPNLFTNIKTEQIGADFSKVVDRISKQYERPDIAFQKEAIQNSWDVRKDRGKGKDWLFKIYGFKDLNKKLHIAVEDWGTKGMNEERWKGFSSLWRPKKDRNDVGGKGQGKFVLMNGSQEHILFVESISDDIGYICKFLQDGKKSDDNENIEISKYIPGVDPLNHKGSRIWVYDVREDFLKNLHSEEFSNSIVECWWQVLCPRFNGEIHLFNKRILYKPLQSPVEEIILCENQQIEEFGRIKRLRLSFYADKVPTMFDGVLVQRANMMITKILFDVHDKDYQGRFSGYIEFDEALERSLKEIERNDHCSFQYVSPWKEIKGLIKDGANKFVSKIIPSKEQRKTINIKNLSKFIQKANQIIDEYCPEILGEGTVVPPITPKPKPPLRIKHLTINKREVKWGDTIKRTCGILNTTNEDKRISLNVDIKRLGVMILEERYSIKIRSGESKSIKLTEIKLLQDKFDEGKYVIRATLQEGRHDIDTKSTSFYLESKREPVKRGFIKKVGFYESEEPVRNKPLKNGTLEINLGHKDFMNIWSVFEDRPNIQSKQIGFYIIKLCFDEAINELLKIRLKADQDLDLDDLVQEISSLKDKMYYEVYA